MKRIAPLFAVLTLAPAAFAQATFATEIEDLATAVSGNVLTGLGAVAGVLALALGIGFVWRKIKQATRAA